MKNKFIIITIGLFIALGFTSCDDVVEIDLSNEEIVSVIPADSTVSLEYSQSFWWEKLKGANGYNLQIVQPDFSTPRKFILDTTLQTNFFTQSLSPGSYQWRVRGENGSSETEYVTHTLVIDSTGDLNDQTVLLSSPANYAYDSSLVQTFSWQTIADAESYLFQLFSGSTSVITETASTNTTTYTFTSEGIYTWKVTAQNSLTTSQPSASRTITIDATKPAMPTAVSPTLDTITANPIPLSWNVATATSVLDSSYSCQLQISTDSTFASVSTKDTVIVNINNPEDYNFYNATIGQNYYWRVQTIDRTGSESGYFSRKRIKRN